jgi:hypothetical protein
MAHQLCSCTRRKWHLPKIINRALDNYRTRCVLEQLIAWRRQQENGAANMVIRTLVIIVHNVCWSKKIGERRQRHDQAVDVIWRTLGKHQVSCALKQQTARRRQQEAQAAAEIMAHTLARHRVTMCFGPIDCVEASITPTTRPGSHHRCTCQLPR